VTFEGHVGDLLSLVVLCVADARSVSDNEVTVENEIVGLSTNLMSGRHQSRKQVNAVSL